MIQRMRSCCSVASLPGYDRPPGLPGRSVETCWSPLTPEHGFPRCNNSAQGAPPLPAIWLLCLSPFKKVPKNRGYFPKIPPKESNYDFLRRHYPHQVKGRSWMTSSQPAAQAPPIFSYHTTACPSCQFQANSHSGCVENGLDRSAWQGGWTFVEGERSCAGGAVKTAPYACSISLPRIHQKSNRREKPQRRAYLPPHGDKNGLKIRIVPR